MIPAEFDYSRPASLDEALELMSERASDSQVMAGGQSLLPLLKLRLTQPGLIVDLSRIAGLSSLDVTPDGIEIGAMTTTRAIEHSSEVAAVCPLLTETVGVVADPHVRNLGTIGGSLCMADPRGDLPACVLALDATMTARSTSGTRTIPVSEFFTGPFSTALRTDELLVGIRIPLETAATSAYVKLSRRAGDFAVVAVAANIAWHGGVCRDARLALCAAGPTPILVGGASEVLAGSRLDDETIGAASRQAESEAEPYEDPLVSVAYRRAMIHTMVGRALRLARERAEGET